MALRAANKYSVEFTTPTLDLLFGRAFPQELAMQEIIHDEGFLSVARSVRDATIYADLKNRPVSFGLAQNWKQKLKSGDAEFLGWARDTVKLVKRVTRSVMIYGCDSPRRLAMAGLMEATHASMSSAN